MRALSRACLVASCLLACLPLACGGGGDPEQECTPSVEICNNLDDDCDGLFDEELDTDADEDGHYTPGSCHEPRDDCDDGDFHVYPGHPEGPSYCDGKDNDCDGQTDEGCECHPGTEEDCGTDEGECTVGRRTCQVNASWGPCSGVGPVDELCDGLDNDCDGQTDNVTAVLPCELSSGVCAGVTRPAGCQACDYGLLYEVEEATCDGLDNDCDGETDEGMAGDGFEANDDCSTPATLTAFDEGDPARLVEASLYKWGPAGAGRDLDWYRIQLNEADHLAECILDGPDQCFEFVLRLELPLSEAQDRWELCLLDGVSGSCADFGDPSYTFCTEPAEWDPGSHSYRMNLYWNGLCGDEDGGWFYLLVRPAQGQTVTACTDYKLWLQWNYVGTFACF